MRIKQFGFFIWALLGVFLLSPTLSTRASAATVEVEEDEGDVDAAPTPAPAKPKSEKPKPVSAVSSPAKKEQVPVMKNREAEEPRPAAQAVASAAEKPALRMPRVRISDKIGFYYFVKSGFVVSEASKVPSAGVVIGSYDKQISYSVPKRTYVEMNENSGVKPGDLLVVYHAVDRIGEPHTGFEGVWVNNLAIVKVLEIDKRRCLVEVKKSFSPFEDGDKVKFYEDELKRWKQAQIKKALPDHEVASFVAFGTRGTHYLTQADFIILTSGSNNGVVEGQKFKLKEMKDLGIMEDPLQLDRGIAQVFYAGPDYSLAQIHFSNLPIEKGFKAIYQP